LLYLEYMKHTRILITLFATIFALSGVFPYQAHADAINSTDFVTTWKTDNPGTSNSTSLTLPIVGGPYDVDWNNDGTYDQTGLTGSVTHDFGVAGTYTIRVKDAKQIRFARGGDRQKIVSVDQWGTSTWISMDRAFDGCTNVRVLTSDAPDTSMVTSLFATFYNATSLDDSGNWAWDTSNVISMRYTFWGALNFNGDISSWNTSQVTTMQEMMSYASKFNQNIGFWDISQVTRMDYFLYDGTDFNQDVSSWNPASLQNAHGIFQLASSFNQDLSDWNITSITDLEDIFYYTNLSTQNYDNILIAWSTQAVQPGVIFTADPTQYCKGQTARQSLIDNHGWNIIDGGYGNCSVYIPATPTIVPDLQSDFDTGELDTDNLTWEQEPTFYVTCSELGSTITLYVDAVDHTTHTCTALGTLAITAPAIGRGIHAITYTESNTYGESANSPSLSIEIERRPSNGSTITYVCKDETATNYSIFGRHQQSLCEYTENQPTTTLPVTTDDVLFDIAQCPHFTTYYRSGDRGGEISKIQTFLKGKGYNPGTVDNIMGPKTITAIKQFQATYQEQILTPWNLTHPTGRWYQSTRYQANKLVGCPEESVKLDNGVTLKK